MDAERTPPEALSSEECIRLLARAGLGRLALNVGALPVVIPVAYLLTPGGILVRLGGGAGLETATQDTVVGFEADDIDAVTGEGWTVTVTGIATPAGEVDADDQARLRAVLGRWRGPEPDRVVRISLDVVCGRRCRASRAAA